MKILKIDSGEAKFLSKDGASYSNIDLIEKEDILRLMKLCIDEEVIYDISENQGGLKINSPAQKIIYDQIVSKFKELIDNKENIINNVHTDFKKAFEKYSSYNEENKNKS